MQVFKPGDAIYVPLPIAVSGTEDSFEGFLLDRATGGRSWDFVKCIVAAPIVASYQGVMDLGGIEVERFDEYHEFMCQQTTMLVCVMADGLVAKLPEDRLATSSRPVPRGLMVQLYGTVHPFYTKRSRSE